MSLHHDVTLYLTKCVTTTANINFHQNFPEANKKDTYRVRAWKIIASHHLKDNIKQHELFGNYLLFHLLFILFFSLKFNKEVMPCKDNNGSAWIKINVVAFFSEI